MRLPPTVTVVFCYAVGTSNHGWFGCFLEAELGIKFSITLWLGLFAVLFVPFPVMWAISLITAGSHLQDLGVSGFYPCISYLPVPPPTDCCTQVSHTAPCNFHIVGLHLTVPLYRERTRKSHTYTSGVRKVSSHFEYLENRSHGLDVTWQPVRGDLTAHPWTVTLPWG